MKIKFFTRKFVLCTSRMKFPRKFAGYEKGMVITMKKSWKYKIRKMTSTNYKLNKKVMQMKRSWDEVEGILNNAVSRKKK